MKWCSVSNVSRGRYEVHQSRTFVLTSKEKYED